MVCYDVLPKMTLTFIPVADCPSCGERANVVSKLLATNWGPNAATTEHYWISDKVRFTNSLYTDGPFVGGLYCTACDIGFIPDSMLNELGITQSESSGKFGWLGRPFGIGEPLSDAERTQNKQNKPAHPTSGSAPI